MNVRADKSDPPRRKIMILMRGMPSCGKTYTSRRLAQAGGAHIEFDDYFYAHAGDDQCQYDWSQQEYAKARRWNLERVKRAVDDGASPIIVDSDNVVSTFTKLYVSYAVENGYEIQFRYPESPWWKTVRSLLKNRDQNRKELRTWAMKLAAMNAATHRVPLQVFLRRIAAWKDEITCEDILAAG